MVRYFCRRFNLLGYDAAVTNPNDAAKVDALLDCVHAEFVWGDERSFFAKLETQLKGQKNFGGCNQPNAADLLAFSCCDGKKAAAAGAQAWQKQCAAFFA